MMASARPASATPMPPAMSRRRDRTSMSSSPGPLYAGSGVARLWPPEPRAFPRVELASPPGSRDGAPQPSMLTPKSRMPQEALPPRLQALLDALTDRHLAEQLEHVYGA